MDLFSYRRIAPTVTFPSGQFAISGRCEPPSAINDPLGVDPNWAITDANGVLRTVVFLSVRGGTFTGPHPLRQPNTPTDGKQKKGEGTCEGTLSPSTEPCVSGRQDLLRQVPNPAVNPHVLDD